MKHDCMYELADSFKTRQLKNPICIEERFQLRFNVLVSSENHGQFVSWEDISLLLCVCSDGQPER